jgi:hypothetical protein
MPLSKDEYKRRVDAAVALNATTLTEVDRILAGPDWKFGQEAASRPGRPGDKAEPSRPLSLALGEILGVGADWFEVADWRSLLREGAAVAQLPDDQLGELKAQRSVLLSTISQVRSELEDLRKPQPHP